MTFRLSVIFFKLFTLALLLVLVSVYPTATQAVAASKGIAVKIKDQSGKPVQIYSGSFALLIGVSRYTAGWPNLESVPQELERMRQALLDHQFHVTTVTDPTSDSLQNAVKRFIDNFGFDPNNRLIIFFSGHGHSRANGTKGYLVPADAPDPRADTLGFLRKAVGMSQVLEWSRRIEAKHALFVFDSCFSGTVFKTKALPQVPPHISDLTARPVRQFISAGSAGEEVPAKSVFVPSFIRALNGEGDFNRDHFVTGTELGMYLHQKVLSYRTGQTPQYGKIRDPDLDVGDIVFSVAKGVEIRPPSSKTIARLPVEDKEVTPPKVQKLAKIERHPQPVAEPETESVSAKDNRFVIRNNGVVLDTSTGLEWVAGPDRDMSRTDAVSWINDLTLDGGGWRLPSRSELRGLYQKQGWFSYVLPGWIEFSGSGIWSNHISIQMKGDQLYTYYAYGTERTTQFPRESIDMRTLSVRTPHEVKK